MIDRATRIAELWAGLYRLALECGFRWNAEAGRWTSPGEASELSAGSGRAVMCSAFVPTNGCEPVRPASALSSEGEAFDVARRAGAGSGLLRVPTFARPGAGAGACPSSARSAEVGTSFPSSLPSTSTSPAEALQGKGCHGGGVGSGRLARPVETP